MRIQNLLGLSIPIRFFTLRGSDSPPRHDVAGAVRFTPQEAALDVLRFQLVEVVILGIDPIAAAAT